MIRKLEPLKNALRVRGPVGLLSVMLEKSRKASRYRAMLLDVPSSRHVADFIARETTEPRSGHVDRSHVLRRADAMLDDQNYYFTFPYKTRKIEDVWNFDPLEHKHWPRRHYTERMLHAHDTPADVKIVWEINRFKDLPTLGQAAWLTHDPRHAEEVRTRLHAWIAGNPFANSINWASGLEIGIRLIAWTATIDLLRRAGFDVHRDERICRSIYEQAAYVRADLSTDRIVRTNHLIGEAAGLFITSHFWKYPGSEEHSRTAQNILEQEIQQQSYDDGATRESSTWYHGFVTDFFELVLRTAPALFSHGFVDRLERMQQFRTACLQPDRSLVRVGDADDGAALHFEALDEEEVGMWKEVVFGKTPLVHTHRHDLFDTSKYISYSDRSNSYLFMRAGEFGMGGPGFSSHAHDDLLSPIVWLLGRPVLVDPGTYVYNGAPQDRRRFRGPEAHNSFVWGESSARQKLNFGWRTVRMPAGLLAFEETPSSCLVRASYGEWPFHHREIRIESENCWIEDVVEGPRSPALAWLHLHPGWKLIVEEPDGMLLENEVGDRLRVTISGWAKSVASYDYSPSYRVQERGIVLQLTAERPRGKFAVRLTLAPSTSGPLRS